MKTPIPSRAILFASLTLGVGSVARADFNDSHTLLNLIFEDTYVGASGEYPQTALNAPFVGGVAGKGVSLHAGSQLSYVANENVQTSPEGTIEYFIKPDWNGNDGHGHFVLSWGGGGGLVLNKDGANNLRIVFNRFSIPVGEQGVAYNVSDWKAGDWHGVAFSWDRNAGYLKEFIDGGLVAQDSITNDLNTPEAQNFDFGTDNGHPEDALDGTLDQVRISDTARSDKEVRDYFDARGQATPEPASLAALGLGAASLLRRKGASRAYGAGC